MEGETDIKVNHIYNIVEKKQLTTKKRKLVIDSDDEEDLKPPK